VDGCDARLGAPHGRWNDPALGGGEKRGRDLLLGEGDCAPIKAAQEEVCCVRGTVLATACARL